MKNIQHTAFYIARDGDKDWLINQVMDGGQLFPGLSTYQLRGEVFSNTTLQCFIDEEIRHDHFEIATGDDNILTNSSSGEQRKALLAHIISQKPDYIVIDSVFESLDTNSRQSILSTLTKFSALTLVIQIFNRRHELLPFIKSVYSIEKRSVTALQDRNTFLAQPVLKGNNNFTGVIPPSIDRYELQKGPLVKMNNVSVQFNGRCVLQNICWEINAGEFWQLSGPNGSGKSTLLSLITGNSPKGYGQNLYLFGYRKGSGETVWDLKEKIGYFAPSMTLQFERSDTAEQMIISGFFDSVGLYIKPTDKQVQLAGEWLSLIGMYEIKNQPFRMFPAAQQRMILIARAMVKHPPLLILDEPTSGLDDDMVVLFTSLINKIADETGSAILYVSHNEEAGLLPGKIFDLYPSDTGSVGKIRKQPSLSQADATGSFHSSTLKVNE